MEQSAVDIVTIGVGVAGKMLQLETNENRQTIDFTLLFVALPTRKVKEIFVVFALPKPSIVIRNV